MFHYGSVKFSSSTVFILQIFRIFHLSPLYGVNVCSNFLAFYVHLSHKIMPFSLVIWCLKAFHWMNEWVSMKEREWICFLSFSFLCIFVMERGYIYVWIVVFGGSYQFVTWQMIVVTVVYVKLIHSHTVTHMVLILCDFRLCFFGIKIKVRMNILNKFMFVYISW